MPQPPRVPGHDDGTVWSKGAAVLHIARVGRVMRRRREDEIAHYPGT